MHVPGEKLLIKMWESLADKGIGALLTPWQMRRVARAAIDSKIEEIRRLAEAEMRIELLKSRPQEPELKGPLLLKGPELERETIPETAAPHAPEVIAHRAQQADALRKEVNVAKAILAAEDALASEKPTSLDDEIEPDWIYRWRDSASTISNEDLQQLWGRVLAGEVKQPGRYSLRAMDFLRNLSKNEAQIIEAIAPFVFDENFIWKKDNDDSSAKPNIDNLLILQGLGLITGVEGLLQQTLRFHPQSYSTQFIKAINKAIVIDVDFKSNSDTEKKLSYSVMALTSTGKEIFSLCSSKANEEYIKKFGAMLRSKGLKVRIGDLVDTPNGLGVRNIKPI